jgi:chemotaxis protein MotB
MTTTAPRTSRRLPRLRRIAPLLLMTAGLGVAGNMGGCASNSELLDSSRALQERNTQLVAENQSLRTALDAAQSELGGLRKANADIRALADQLLSENARLKDLLARYDSEFQNLKFAALDTETDAALRELAAQYPDLIEYDAARGLLRFKSDFTFGSGSDVVSSSGKSSIDALARILNSPAAQNYDIRIIGHTDSQRISANTARNHPTNWHLSTHRAISVGRELQTMGIDPTRIEAAGRGEYDPLVPNTGSGNTPQNRRVDIYIVRGYRRGAGATAPQATPAAPPSTPALDDDMK